VIRRWDVEADSVQRDVLPLGPTFTAALPGGLAPGEILLACGVSGVGKTRAFMQFAGIAASSGVRTVWVTTPAEQDPNSLRRTAAAIGAHGSGLIWLELDDQATASADLLEVVANAGRGALVVCDSLVELASPPAVAAMLVRLRSAVRATGCALIVLAGNQLATAYGARSALLYGDHVVILEHGDSETGPIVMWTYKSRAGTKGRIIVQQTEFGLVLQL
jgi:predicted ATP-dependent serine protease